MKKYFYSATNTPLEVLTGFVISRNLTHLKDLTESQENSSCLIIIHVTTQQEYELTKQLGKNVLRYIVVICQNPAYLLGFLANNICKGSTICIENLRELKYADNKSEVDMYIQKAERHFSDSIAHKLEKWILLHPKNDRDKPCILEAGKTKTLNDILKEIREEGSTHRMCANMLSLVLDLLTRGKRLIDDI